MGRTIAATPQTRYATSKGAKFNADTTLEVVHCHTCGIPYAIPTSLVASAKRYRGDTANGWKLCCPLGHTWFYVGETREARLKRQLKDANDTAAIVRAWLDQERAHSKAMKSVATRRKNELDRQRKRAAAGVCPCCGRTFQQLARHMAAKHPDYAESPA